MRKRRTEGTRGLDLPLHPAGGVRSRPRLRAAMPRCLRELNRRFELPGANRLRDAQAALDRAVDEAYRDGLPGEMAGLEPLPLLALNQTCAAAEGEGRSVVGPGLLVFCGGRFHSEDCLRTLSPRSQWRAGASAHGVSLHRPGRPIGVSVRVKRG